MKNKKKTDEMVDILSQLQQYVPMIASTTSIEVPDTGVSEVVVSERLRHLLIGGDQLTSERVRGVQSIHKNSMHAVGAA